MQTFLPYEDFKKTASVLDRERLGKQRSECKQIFNALYFGGGWKNHPAVRMWRGHGYWLYTYYLDIVFEWQIVRKYVHNMSLSAEVIARAQEEQARPYWLGIETFHASHRNMLVAKNPEHYGALFKDTQFNGHYGYTWPVDAKGHSTIAHDLPF